MFITWFGCGALPFAPGTYGSIGAIPLCYLMKTQHAFSIQLLICIVATVVAIMTSAQDQARAGAPRDPGYIVIDEVAGMLWSCLAVSIAEPLHMVIVFVIFRILDMAKPFPANWLDRKSKTAISPFARGFYIVMDDVVSGIFTCILCYFAFLHFHI